MATYQTLVQPEIKTNNVAVQPVQRVEFVYACREFVLWLHKNLRYSTINNALKQISAIKKVDLGIMYKAWQNNQPLPEALKSRYECRPHGIIECDVCKLPLSNVEIRRSLLTSAQYKSDCKIYCGNHVPLTRPKQHDNKTGIFSIITNDGKADRLLNEMAELERVARNSKLVIEMSNNHVGPIVISSVQFMHLKRNTRGISDLVEILGNDVVILEQAYSMHRCMFCRKNCEFNPTKGFHIKMCYECYYRREAQFVK